jgi:hypothetical protein
MFNAGRIVKCNKGVLVMATANLPEITQLSSEEKRQLFAILARDLLHPGRGPLTVEDATGELLLYEVPAESRALAERALREADPTYLAELLERAATTEQSLSLEEAIRLPPT